jgi:nitrilase
MPRPVTVAIVQAAQHPLDLAGGLEAAANRTREAAARGARLVVFGESWLGGYPAWLDCCPAIGLWEHGPTKEVFARLRRSSIVVPGPETALLGGLAAELGVVLVMGANERVDSGPGNGTLYNAMLVFDADGKLVQHHRKLVPTHTERLVWGPGDARGLGSSATRIGRVGGLICWEHWMPLARQALHDAGEQIHVALWPSVQEPHQIASRHYAFEGRCFVLAAGSIMRAEDLPAELERPEPGELVLRGGSAVIGPDGKYLTEPVYEQDALIVHDLDLDAIDKERMTLDVSGHYARPDLFDFTVHRAGPRTGVRRAE